MYNTAKTKKAWPVTLSEVKSHLRIDPDIFEDDAYLESIVIPSATGYCENFIGKDIALTSNVYTIYDFSGSDLRIDAGNLKSVDYVITDSSSLITGYETRKNRDYFILEFSSTVTSDPLTVQFTTGYAEGECPVELKKTILIKCGDDYDVERSSYTLSTYKKTESNGIGLVERRLMAHKVIMW